MALENLKSKFAPGNQSDFDGKSKLQSRADIHPNPGPGLYNNTSDRLMHVNKYNTTYTRQKSLADVFPSQAGLKNLSSPTDIIKKTPIANAKGASSQFVGADNSTTGNSATGGGGTSGNSGGDTSSQEGQTN